MDPLAILTILISVMLITGLWAWWASRRPSVTPSPPSSPSATPQIHEPTKPVLPRAAFVVNPSKFDDAADVQRRFTAICRAQGWGEPLWLETTPDSPGEKQAHQALAAGVRVVIAVGGDGTVRHVSRALAKSGTPLGLVPAGTGNLLARNLDINISDDETAVRDALTGTPRTIDLAEVTTDRCRTGQTLCVMAGVGFDARIMQEAPETLKAHLGPVAYTVAGLRHLKGEQIKVGLRFDSGRPVHRRVQTVMVGNCGKLQGGLPLLPNALIDDGKLDTIAMSPDGLVGWLAVTAAVVTKNRKGHERLQHWQSGSVEIRCLTPQPAQIDGDPIGEVRSMTIRVVPDALVVHVPADGPA